eukprot:TRINITY_DN3304_c0_g1_i2.p1 TRINITY_DN3304_c0_g1~~TRINITY_DN3304_c0_g1_i2.p1  ORF type:complete len:314 (-),score=59.98 TRINITY_DN3304_c0_g1_i2:30-971(-)
MANIVTESYWKTFIRNLNPPKAARDISMVAALNAAMAGGMISFVQTVPPDIKNVMDFADWLSNDPIFAVKKMWRRRRIVKKQQVMDDSIHAATRGAIQKTMQVAGKAYLSTRWGLPADVVVSRRFERTLRPLLDLGRRAHSALTGAAYTGPFYTVQDFTMPLYKAVSSPALSRFLYISGDHFVSTLFFDSAAFMFHLSVDLMATIKREMTLTEFLLMALRDFIGRSFSLVGGTAAAGLTSLVIRSDHWFWRGAIMVIATFAGQSVGATVRDALLPKPRLAALESPRPPIRHFDQSLEFDSAASDDEQSYELDG